jgi:cell division protein FtsQ
MGKVAELKNKSPKRGKKFVITLFSIALIVAASYTFAMKSSFFNIKNLSVSGNKKLTEERVLLYSGIAMGDNLIKLDKDEVKLNLKSEPYIESVEVQKKLPSGVVLKIVEKKDILVIDGEKKIYLDSKGEVLSLGADFKSYPVPILEGMEVKSAVISKQIEYKNDIDGESFSELMKGLGDLILYDSLSSVKILENGEAELYFGPGQVVRFGELKDVEYKLSYLNEILKDLEKKDKIFETIDFTRGSRVIVEEKLVREEE